MRSKASQHKSFIYKLGYTLMGVVIGLFLPKQQTLTTLDNIQEYVSGSALLMVIITSFITSYVKKMWDKRSTDK